MGANIIMNSNQVEIGHLLGSPEKFPWKHSFSYIMLQWRNITMVTWKIVVDWQSGDVLRRKYQKLFQWTVMAPLS